MNFNRKNLNINNGNEFYMSNSQKNIFNQNKNNISSLNKNEIPSYSDKIFYKYFIGPQLDDSQKINKTDNYNNNFIEPYNYNNFNYNNNYEQQNQLNTNINSYNNNYNINNKNKIQFTNEIFTRQINDQFLYKNPYEENSSFRRFPVNYYTEFFQNKNKIPYNSLNFDNNNNNNNNYNNNNNNNINTNNNNNLNQFITNNNYQTILNNELKELNINETKKAKYNNMRYKYSPKQRNYWNSSEYTHEYVGYDPEFYIPNEDNYGVKSQVPYFNNIFRNGDIKSNYDKYFPKKKENKKHNDANNNNNIEQKNSIQRIETLKSNQNEREILNKKTRGSNLGEEIIFGVIEGTGEDATKKNQIMDFYIDGDKEINVRKKN
jgi:hypothetical protein